MRLLADENIDRLLVFQLRKQGHDTLYAVEDLAGLDDSSLLARAYDFGAVLITEDKGFGELVVGRRLPCRGLVLLRLNELSRKEAIAAAARAIERLGVRLIGFATVVQPGVVRSRRLIPNP